MDRAANLAKTDRQDDGAWFSAYVVLGAVAALSLLSLGWLLLAPVLLVVVATLFVPAARRAVPGLAIGAGLVFAFFAVMGTGRPYARPLALMAAGLLVAGVAEQIRRTWVNG
jgi:hypothetical protein